MTEKEIIIVGNIGNEINYKNIDDFDDLLNCFENLIFDERVIESFKKHEKKFLGHLIGNIYRDFKAVNLLLKNDFLIQSQKLMRHVFEALVLLVYLDKCPNNYSQKDYVDDSNIWKLRKIFISYKQAKNNKINPIFICNGRRIENVSEKDVFLSKFNNMYKSIPKEKFNLLNLFEPSELSEQTFDEWEKFFRLNNLRKIKFTQITTMLEDIDKSNFTIECKGNKKLTLEEFLRDRYNIYSQIAHNTIINLSKEAEEIELFELYIFKKNIIIIVYTILIDNGIINDNMEQEFNTLKSILEKPTEICVKI